SRISRTHGVLDPASFTIRDLNSANGIRVNGALIGRTPGHPGPPHPLASEDIVQLGQTEFLVGVERITREALLERLARSRRGFVGPAGVPEAERLGGFLRERKRFEVHACETWAGMLQTVGALRYSAPIFGVIVLAWVVEPLGGDRMRVGDEEVGLDALLFMLGTIPGSKVLALQSKGDPAGLEAVFRDLALQDTILLTSTIPDTGGLEPDGVLPEIGTIPADALRQSVADGGGLFDSIVDGLDALVSPESNVLRVEWAERYEGALRMVVGTRRPSADVEVELSYQPSSEGTVRVTHTLSNTLTGPSAGEDTLIGL
ncbi:MAG: FHA domain-containing protein, partial [Planctomycetes bacterium]|nr:FHA domain-containing protein [Planctomycetota bacterium]